ncbi:MAG: methylated-DNA--[protein]-cysteine S-methyltransferase [Pseudonocardia sp.]|nr:methylated-DNA--[protein]-cysteine S-methyltransferase [Pseudonocardia sp.]
MTLVCAVLPAPAPIGALTIGVTGAGLALVAFGDASRAAQRAAARLGVSLVAAPAGAGGTLAPAGAGGTLAPAGAGGTLAPAGAGNTLGATAEATEQLREYLAGSRRAVPVALDWSLTSGSRRRVLETLHDTVPFGTTVTYGELAARSGLGHAHTAARGVGAIMGSNPLPLVVPCHRVLGADGLGGFGGGRAVKEWLLALEGVLTPALEFG